MGPGSLHFTPGSQVTPKCRPWATEIRSVWEGASHSSARGNGAVRVKDFRCPGRKRPRHCPQNHPFLVLVLHPSSSSASPSCLTFSFSLRCSGPVNTAFYFCPETGAEAGGWGSGWGERWAAAAHQRQWGPLRQRKTRGRRRRDRNLPTRVQMAGGD